MITLTTINSAYHIVERYGFSHYDSLIIATALQADYITLCSEDMQHDQIIDNRFSVTPGYQHFSLKLF